MKIAYLMQEGVPDLDTVSGPQLHVRAVIAGLHKRGHHVRTFLPRAGKPVWADDLAAPDWRAAQYGFSASPFFRAIESPVRRAQTIFRFPYFNLFESVRFMDAATRPLADCDLIFERFGILGYAGVLTGARLGVPLVLEINGDVPKEMERLGVQMSPGQRSVLMQITRFTFAAATGIVCVAPLIKERLVESMRLDPAKIEAIPNGADTEIFSAPQDANAVRQKYHLAARPTVTFVGSFQPWHGVELLVDSFGKVVRQIPDAQLVLVGDGDGRASVAQRVASQGLGERVRFMGRLENAQVAGILAVSDVAAAPFPFKESDIIGSPLKLFEYMAAGRAIVASNAPIHQVIQDGVTGLRVAPADAGALASALARLLSDSNLRQQLGARARETALKHYSWDNTILQLENFFARLLAQRASDTAAPRVWARRKRQEQRA